MPLMCYIYIYIYIYIYVMYLLNDAFCILQSTYTLEKDLNPGSLPPSMGRADLAH